MQLSKSKQSKKEEAKMYDIFYQTFADFSNKKEAEIFLTDFLSSMEKVKLAKRLMTALYLEKGKSYDFIKKTVRVSSATIASVDKMMAQNGQGFLLVFKKIDADRWAEKNAEKINNFFKNILSK
jgi:uncharacterized protein YerC